MKRGAVLLAGLMMVGMSSFAETGTEFDKEGVEGNYQFNSLNAIQGNSNHSDSDILLDGILNDDENEKPASDIGINNEFKFNKNRTEVNGTFHVSEMNKVRIRLRHETVVGSGNESAIQDSLTSSDSSEMRLRLYTQTGIENFEIRSAIKLKTHEDKRGSERYNFEPSYDHFTDIDALSSITRVGLEAFHDREKHGQNFTFNISTENEYVFNDYFALEANIYYYWAFAGNLEETTDNLHELELEAYLYFNYPLYVGDTFRVDFLAETGIDPYGISARFMKDFDDVQRPSSHGSEYYCLYFEPTIEASQEWGENSKMFLQAGYYIETNQNINKPDDTLFVKAGISTKFM